MNSIKENDEEFMFKDIIQKYDLDLEYMTGGLHNGISFTGFTFSMHPATGQLELLTPFKDGFQDGIYRKWHENGQLREVREVTHGQSDGYKICWYPNGSLKSEVQYMEGFVIYEKVCDEEENIIENKVFIDNIDIYRTWYKNGITRYQKDPEIYIKLENDRFTCKLIKLLIKNECNKNISLEQDNLNAKGQEVLEYIESNINGIHDREILYKNAVKKEMMQFNGNQALYNGKPFTGLVYDMPFVEAVGSYILFGICTYKNGYLHGNYIEWYSEGMVRPENIIKEGCCDDGEYWYSKGFLKKYAHYELSNELYYKEWDELGNLIEERKAN